MLLLSLLNDLLLDCLKSFSSTGYSFFLRENNEKKLAIVDFFGSGFVMSALILVNTLSISRPT